MSVSIRTIRRFLKRTQSFRQRHFCDQPAGSPSVDRVNDQGSPIPPVALIEKEPPSEKPAHKPLRGRGRPIIRGFWKDEDPFVEKDLVDWPERPQLEAPKSLRLMDWLMMPQLQYMMSNEDGKKTCKMTMNRWLRATKPCFWTITKVRYPVPGLYVPGAIWGYRTVFGVEEKEEALVTETTYPGWTWIPCKDSLKYDPTKKRNFKPVLHSLVDKLNLKDRMRLKYPDDETLNRSALQSQM